MNEYIEVNWNLTKTNVKEQEKRLSDLDSIDPKEGNHTTIKYKHIKKLENQRIEMLPKCGYPKRQKASRVSTNSRKFRRLTGKIRGLEMEGEAQ